MAAEAALEAFEAGPWGQKYLTIAQSRRRAWGQVIPPNCDIPTNFPPFLGDVLKPPP